jgi:chlorite dismutase
MSEGRPGAPAASDASGERPDAPTERLFSHYSALRFTPAYWALESNDRRAVMDSLVATLPSLAQRVFTYNLSPARPESDIMLWCTNKISVSDTGAAEEFFQGYVKASKAWRKYLEPTNTLWGFTRPSHYNKGKSSQEMNPFADERQPYLIAYPFSKTHDWYMMAQDTRQGMMNEHIRIGRQHTEITQLLLYCTGLADQEFVVVYESDSLPAFSKLVTELRSTDGRPYTLRDTPIYTANHIPIDQLADYWA